MAYTAMGGPLHCAEKLAQAGFPGNAQSCRSNHSSISTLPLKRPRDVEVKVSEHKINDQKLSQPSELTLWDIVVRNRRKRRRDEDTSQSQSDNDDTLKLNHLLNFSTSDDQATVKKQITTPRDDIDDLFEHSDDFLNSDRQTDILRLDAHGNLLLDELKLDRIANNRDQFIQSSEGRDLVNEDYLEAGTVQPYSQAYKFTKATQWSKIDEEKYFTALETFGLDFTMIQTFLPHFTLKQLRDKYRCEEKKRPGKIDSLLLSRRPISLENYEKVHGKIDQSKHFKWPPNDDQEDGLDINAHDSAPCASPLNDFIQCEIQSPAKHDPHDISYLFDTPDQLFDDF